VKEFKVQKRERIRVDMEKHGIFLVSKTDFGKGVHGLHYQRLFVFGMILRPLPLSLKRDSPNADSLSTTELP
jgi:hypothetical protein